MSTLVNRRETSDLARFFSRLQECRNKNDHVHALHPYPAKFIPHIPRALIGALADERDVVLDPLCGSGTTLVESTLSGHPAVGVDLNPVATLVSRAKTSPLSATERLALRSLAAELESAAKRVREGRAVHGLRDASVPEFHNREKWFSGNVCRELAYAKAMIDGLGHGPGRDLALCAMSSIVVAVSNQESETRWCAKPRTVDDGATLAKLAAKVADSLERVEAYQAQAQAPATVLTCDARTLPLRDSSVGLVVTSPPYANSHDYYLYNKLRMFWLGEDVHEVQRREIGSRNRHSDLKEDIGSYTDAMRSVLRECHRALRPGGAAAIVVADAIIRKEFFDMREIFNELAASAGFEIEAAYAFNHKLFNTTFQRGFGSSRDKQTHVLIYRAA